MAMTAQVKAELASTQITKTCCRKAERSEEHTSELQSH